MTDQKTAVDDNPPVQKRPLYVLTHGVSIGKSNNLVQIKHRGNLRSETSVEEIESLNIYGNAQLNSQAITLLMDNDIPIFHFNYFGLLRGVTMSHGNNDADLRTAQFAAAADEDKARLFGAAVGEAKNRSRLTILRRHHPDIHPLTIENLSDLRRQIRTASNLSLLKNQDSEATNLYGTQFIEMLAAESTAVTPPKDPENKSRSNYRKSPAEIVLALSYTVLLRQFMTNSIRLGLDPYKGIFLDSPKGEPALALDLREEFNQPVADYVVIRMFRSGEFTVDDFRTNRFGNPFLNRRGMEKVTTAIERRLGVEYKHPAFDHAVSFRRVIGAQTELFAKFLLGQADYEGFSIR